MPDPEPLDINGTQPSLEGLTCEAFVAQQYWHHGVLENPVNVAHFRFGGQWHRLYFDWGIVYWRRGDEAPTAFDAPEIDAEYRLHDIAEAGALLGRELLSIWATAHARGSRVTFSFSGGKSLTLDCTDDRTTYSC